MIDCSHANSSKDYKRQAESCRNVAGQLAAGDGALSASCWRATWWTVRKSWFLASRSSMGKSITDGCMGWATDRRLARRTCRVRASWAG